LHAELVIARMFSTEPSVAEVRRANGGPVSLRLYIIYSKRTMHGRRRLSPQSAIRSIGPPKIARTCDTATSWPDSTRRVSRRIGRVVRRLFMTAARPALQSSKFRSTSRTVTGVSIRALTFKGLTKGVPQRSRQRAAAESLTLIQISPLSAPLPRESQTIRSPLIQCKVIAWVLGITQTAIIERKHKRLESPLKLTRLLVSYWPLAPLAARKPKAAQSMPSMQFRID